MPINYSHHGGHHQVSVVHCPRILENRLAQHLSQDGPGSLALRGVAQTGAVCVSANQEVDHRHSLINSCTVNKPVL